MLEENKFHTSIYYSATENKHFRITDLYSFLFCHNDLIFIQTKQLMDAHNRKMELESALSELEKTARHQLQDLANHSEAAIEAAQEKLIEAHGQIQQYQQFVKVIPNRIFSCFFKKLGPLIKSYS